jgi:transcriptional regulator with XRE-family HTH domain
MSAGEELIAQHQRLAGCGVHVGEWLIIEQLSRMTGIPRPHISGMERGARPIDKEKAGKLAALNCDYRLFL